MALREILVELGFEIDKNSQKKAEKSVGNLTKGLSGLKKVALGLGGAFITGKLAQGLFSMVETASDAAEIANKLGAVFGNELTPEVNKFGDELSRRIGQSRIQIQEMSADVGALVKPLVGSTEAAADMAKTVTELSFDIASFENVRPEEALIAFRSALIGSSEPMLRFGVDTRQAALAQFALDRGIKKSIKSMSSAEVTALRLELIQKRLGEKGAVGDATKTAGGLANQMRALQGSFRDLQAEIGKEFIPVALEFVGILISAARTAGPGLAKAARFLSGVFRTLGRSVLAVTNALSGTNSIALILTATMTALLVAINAVGAAAVLAWLKSTIPLILFIGLIGVLIGVLFLVLEDIFKMGQGADSVIGTMIVGIQGLIDEFGLFGAVFEFLRVGLQDVVSFWLEAFGFTRDEASELVDALTETFRSFFSNIIDFWTDLFFGFLKTIGDGFKNAASFVLDLVGADESAERLDQLSSQQIGKSILRGAAGAIGGPVAATAASAIPVPAQVSPSPSINSSTEIRVDASSITDPATVADMIARRVDKVNEDRNRQAQQSFLNAK